MEAAQTLQFPDHRVELRGDAVVIDNLVVEDRTLVDLVKRRLERDIAALETVTVAAARCGYSERWEPRPERVTEWRFCTQGRRWRLAALFDYHEFFGQAVTQRFTCQGRLVPRPTVVRVGFRWTDRCRGAGSRVTVRYVAEREQVLRVGGAAMRTVLIRARARLRGRIDGLNAYDSWLSRTDGLLVRRRVRSATSIDTPFGKVGDRERYSLELRSLKPR